MINTIQKEIAYLESIEQQLHKTLEKAPEGNLRCSSCKGYYQYYSGKTYLGENKKHYRSKLAQRDYCLKLSKKVKKYLMKLRELLELYEKEALEDAYRTLHPARKQLFDPFIKPIEDRIRDFESAEYTKPGFSENDETAYYTTKGERVRSKSEKIIADTLNRYDIPYQYEMPLDLTDRGKPIRIHPDFTIMNKRAGEI